MLSPEPDQGLTGHRQSPYELVLADQIGELHPHLQAYFSGIPTGGQGFHFRGRDRQMVDEITAEGADLVDYLGYRRRYRAQLTTTVRSGILVMRSSGMAVRVGSAWLRVPRWIAPEVSLTERVDDTSGRQQVDVVTTVPSLGRVYEYAGSFRYELRRRDGGAT